MLNLNALDSILRINPSVLPQLKILPKGQSLGTYQRFVLISQ